MVNNDVNSEMMLMNVVKGEQWQYNACLMYQLIITTRLCRFS